MCFGGGGPSTPAPTPLPPPPPAPEPPAPVLPTPTPVVKPVNPAIRKKIGKKSEGRSGTGSLRIPLDPGTGMTTSGGPSGGVNT